MAVNCSAPPRETLTGVGVTLIDEIATTLSVAALLLMLLRVALTVVEPPATPVARPLGLIVAIDGDATLHITDVLTFAVVPSL